MSWSWGGFNTNGLILDEESFKNILKFGTEKTKELLEIDSEDTIESVLDYEDNIYDISYCFNGIDCNFLSVGAFRKLNSDKRYEDIDIYEHCFEERSVFIVYLEKDTLFECYKDYNEIVKEIENFVINELGVDLEKMYNELGTDYLKDRIGNLNGFYSDR